MLNDVTLVVTGLVVALGTLFGLAYLLQKRTKSNKFREPAKTKLNAASKKLLWVIRGLVIL